ncbi:hypothetical protein MKW98_009513 [Papaver atlanticum]|uniref:Uncharacterized protein n=1 Tax=Papaver atlanticum TaxID=357466 RepID=A0AAD4SGI4_9MAGN|nr:hypothetical protein MKW98_009513 [Papaver atlanticum]
MGVSSDLICVVRNSGFHQIFVSRKEALKFRSKVFHFKPYNLPNVIAAVVESSVGPYVKRTLKMTLCLQQPKLLNSTIAMVPAKRSFPYISLLVPEYLGMLGNLMGMVRKGVSRDHILFNQFVWIHINQTDNQGSLLVGGGSYDLHPLYPTPTD